MSRKNRNNSLRIKKSLQKTLLKTNEAVKAGKKRQLEAQKLKEKEEKERLEKERRQRILESLKEMSYNDLRKLASETGITIYQRKKGEIKQDLKEHYERLWSETH